MYGIHAEVLRLVGRKAGDHIRADMGFTSILGGGCFYAFREDAAVSSTGSG